MVWVSSNSLLTVPGQWFGCGSLLPVFGVGVSLAFRLACVRVLFGLV